MEIWVSKDISSKINLENMHNQSTFRQLSASCFCGACQYSFSVEESQLPFQPYLCSCNISRRISGVLFTAYVAVPSGNASPDLRSLSGYKSSHILTRYFCSTCGTHMFLEYNDDGHFEVSTGSLLSEGNSDDVVKYKGHMWIEDTKDGGASVWVPRLNGSVCERHARESNAKFPRPLALNWKSTFVAHLSPESRLRAHCHCGSVEFYITRPDENSYKTNSPFPDVLVPYNSDVSTENSQGTTWWISKDRKRYLAGNCACKSCQRLSGFDLQQWAFVPLTNVQALDGSQLDDSTLKDVVTAYSSSPGVKRTFCKSCGANVFWQSEQRQTLLDISAGLFDSETGARAEEWLDWVTNRVSFSEEAHHKELVVSMKEGLLQWRHLNQASTQATTVVS